MFGNRIIYPRTPSTSTFLKIRPSLLSSFVSLAVSHYTILRNTTQPFREKSVTIHVKMDLKQEKEVVERAKSDPEEFGKLYDQYYLQVFRYVLKRMARVEIAQDITSTVFFKALNNIHKFHWNGVPFSAWLYRIANNELVNHLRKNGQRQEDVENFTNTIELASPSPESELLAAEARLKKYEKFLILHKSIASLPVRYQEVIVLRYFENKHIHEICEILGKREGTVKSLLFRGLGKLRNSMNSNATFREISR